MNIDNSKILTIFILITLFLLGLCVTCDYADEIIINNMNNTTITLNETYVNLQDTNSTSEIIGKTKDRVHEVYPTITIKAKPSCGCKYSYRWHTTTFVNYCPHCHRYGTLYNKHKSGARYEQELTCRYDDCDYCGVCGKEKYSWSKYYLKKV